MTLNRSYLALIFLNIFTLCGAAGLLYYQSESNKVKADEILAEPLDKDSSRITPISDLEGSQSKTEAEVEPVVLPKPEPKKPVIHSISIYSINDEAVPAFTTLKDRSQLVVLASNGEWSEVISSIGFPVWVHGDLVEKFGPGYVSVTTNRANARIKPQVENSASLGKLRASDVLKVNRKQGDWVRVWSPLKFKAWVKTNDLQ